MNDRRNRVLGLEVLQCPTGDSSPSEVIALRQSGELDFYSLSELTYVKTVSLSAPPGLFRNISWDEPFETMVVMSRNNLFCDPEKDHVRTAISFTVHPWRHYATIKFTKEEWGQGLKDVTVRDGMVITYVAGDWIKVYSFAAVLELGSQAPVLFATRSKNNVLSFGGAPWHYICSPSHGDNFLLGHLDSQKFVPVLDEENESKTITALCNDDADDAVMLDELIWFGNAYMMLHQSAYSLKAYEFLADPFPDKKSVVSKRFKSQSKGYMLGGEAIAIREDCPTVLSSRFNIIASEAPSASSWAAEPKPREVPGEWYVAERPRRSGSRPRANMYAEEPEEKTVIDSWDYEDELDLLVVAMRGAAYIYEAGSGRLLEVIKLEHWGSLDENAVYLDRNCLVHLSKKGSTHKATAYTVQFEDGEQDYGGHR